VAFRIERRVGEAVGEEGADDGGLGDDFFLEDRIGDFDGGDETARVDVEVPFWWCTAAGQWYSKRPGKV